MDEKRPDLVLSLFPGLGVLDKAFEEAGWCVVRTLFGVVTCVTSTRRRATSTV